MCTAYWLSISPRRLLLLAAVLHITLAVVLTLVGKLKVDPHTFDSNGVGIAFALDSVSYRHESLKMAALLREGKLRDWANYRAPLATFHARIYSISYALFGRVLGEGILGVEPINLLYYLSILVLTYFVGAFTFSPSIGRLAAVVVALWPSLLIFTTQLLRDPLFICAFLLLLLVLMICVKHSLSFKQACICSASGIAAVFLLILVRSTMWEVIVAAVLLATLLCVAAQVSTRKFDAPRTIAMLLICLAVLLLPKIMSVRRVTDRVQRPTSVNSFEKLPAAAAPWTKASRQIGWARHLFITRYAQAGSNLDTDVEIRNFRDLILYLPRAVQIGFFAPFPSMWFSKGVEVGLTGRLVIGAEMLALYLIMVLAAVGLIHERRRLLPWFLFATAVLGCVALAYVVVNASALYRLRYPYFIPIILLAVQGSSVLKKKYRSRFTSQSLSHAETE